MRTGKEGLALIKKFETCVLKPYRCPAGAPTIGWGNTYYENGAKVTLKDPPIAQERADQLLLFVLGLIAADIASLLKKPLRQNQFDALSSFAYNVGSDIDADHIPEGLGDSHLLKLINADPEDPAIRQEFLKWDKCKGRRLPGLTRRRMEEADLYFKKP